MISLIKGGSMLLVILYYDSSWGTCIPKTMRFFFLENWVKSGVQYVNEILDDNIKTLENFFLML